MGWLVCPKMVMCGRDGRKAGTRPLSDNGVIRLLCDQIIVVLVFTMPSARLCAGCRTHFAGPR